MVMQLLENIYMYCHTEIKITQWFLPGEIGFCYFINNTVEKKNSNGKKFFTLHLLLITWD